MSQEEEQIRRINEVLRNVVDLQISANEPPETRQVMEDLIGLGYSADQCYEMISKILVVAYRDIHEGGTFDLDRYRENLLKLRSVKNGSDQSDI